MDDDQEFFTFVDNFPQDCADYFAATVEREYKEVDTSIEMATDWRFLCRIIIPKDFEKETYLEKFCFDLQTRIFFELNMLTAYIIERENDDAQ